jgi:hypothetical protein
MEFIESRESLPTSNDSGTTIVNVKNGLAYPNFNFATDQIISSSHGFIFITHEVETRGYTNGSKGQSQAWVDNLGFLNVISEFEQQL